MSRTRPAGWLGSQRGSSSVEFALILPLMAVLLFAFFEVGRAFWTYQIVSASARDAARFAARLQVVCAGMNPDDEARVKRLARTGTVHTGADPLIPGWTSDADITVSVSCVNNPEGTPIYAGVYENVTTIPVIEVAARVPYEPLYHDLLPTMGIDEVRVRHEETWTR